MYVERISVSSRHVRLLKEKLIQYDSRCLRRVADERHNHVSRNIICHLHDVMVIFATLHKLWRPYGVPHCFYSLRVVAQVSPHVLEQHRVSLQYRFLRHPEKKRELICEAVQYVLEALRVHIFHACRKDVPQLFLLPKSSTPSSDALHPNLDRSTQGRASTGGATRV
jgi:hypothetical protein